MADARLKERLQPALLDRLNDTVGSIERELKRLRDRLFGILDDKEKRAYEKLVDLESRSFRPVKDDDLKAFSRLKSDEIDLLKRVVELEQSKVHELRQHHVISVDRLKKCVERDLEWLLNTDQLDGSLELADFPNVASSVVNYGMPSLTGSTSSTVNIENVQRALRDVIRNYEPRIRSDTVRVRAQVDNQKMNNNSIVFEIEGELWGEPLPLRLYLQTVIDLESGSANVGDRPA